MRQIIETQRNNTKLYHVMKIKTKTKIKQN